MNTHFNLFTSVTEKANTVKITLALYDTVKRTTYICVG